MLQLAKPFGNSMVLQRDKPLPVWGQAAPGARLHLRIQGQPVTADADSLTARVEGDSVWLTGPALQAAPARVEVAQGAWYQVNLYNSARLPACPAFVTAVPMA